MHSHRARASPAWPLTAAILRDLMERVPALAQLYLTPEFNDPLPSGRAACGARNATQGAPSPGALKVLRSLLRLCDPRSSSPSPLTAPQPW